MDVSRELWSMAQCPKWSPVASDILRVGLGTLNGDMDSGIGCALTASSGSFNSNPNHSAIP